MRARRNYRASVGPMVRLIYYTPMRGTDQRCMIPNDFKVWTVRCWRARSGADQCTLAPSKNSQLQKAWRHSNYCPSQSPSRTCATFAPRDATCRIYRAPGCLGLQREPANACLFRARGLLRFIVPPWYSSEQMILPSPKGSPFTLVPSRFGPFAAGFVGRSFWGHANRPSDHSH